MDLAEVFIRVKVRRLKPDLYGNERVSWDFRLVESRRVEGKNTPQQRTLLALGSFRPDAYFTPPSVQSEFMASVGHVLEAAGFTFTDDLRSQVRALLERKYERPTVQTVARVFGYLKRHHAA